MPLSDIITAPFLISLGITLLLVGIMVIFIMQRFQEQNHKISSMFGLVSSMAEEMNYMRGKLQSVTFTAMSPSQKNMYGGGVDGVTMTSASDKLIDVSDGEEDSEDDSGEDSEGDSDSDSDEDSDGEDSDNEAKVMCTHNVIDICADDILANLASTIKVINISENFTINNTLGGADIDINDEIDELSSQDSSSSDSSSDDDEDDLEEQDHVPINTSISISAEKLNTLDLLKSIHISNLEETNKEFAVLDYKKMSLNKLRSIVVEKGIATSAAKLKKEELLKLLSVVE